MDQGLIRGSGAWSGGPAFRPGGGTRQTMHPRDREPGRCRDTVVRELRTQRPGAGPTAQRARATSRPAGARIGPSLLSAAAMRGSSRSSASGRGLPFT